MSREEYYPFGETSFCAPSKQRYRFCEERAFLQRVMGLQEESGLYYYGARYYAAWCCRFVSVDPLAGKYPFYTPYQYAGNQPIISVDIDGLEGDNPTSSQTSKYYPAAQDGTPIVTLPEVSITADGNTGDRSKNDNLYATGKLKDEGTGKFPNGEPRHWNITQTIGTMGGQGNPLAYVVDNEHVILQKELPSSPDLEYFYLDDRNCEWVKFYETKQRREWLQSLHTIDAYGVNIDVQLAEFEVGSIKFNGHVGISFVHFTNGPEAGRVHMYVYLGVNSSSNVPLDLDWKDILDDRSIEEISARGTVSSFAASWGGPQELMTYQSWTGWFDYYNASFSLGRFKIGGGYFKSPGEEPGWSGVQIDLGTKSKDKKGKEKLPISGGIDKSHYWWVNEVTCPSRECQEKYGRNYEQK